MTTSPAILAALKTAQPGDIIRLPPSATPYEIAETGRSYDPAVTFTSEDPANPAAFFRVRLNGCKGLVFDGVNIAAPTSTTGGTAAQVRASSDVYFIRVQAASTGDVALWGGGISFTDCQRVSVRDSEFSNLKNGLAFGRCTGVEAVGNYFHDIRIDGITAPSCSTVVIAENAFKDFRHVDGDHSDAIQFWTSGQTTSAKGVVIRDNAMVEGNGAGFQGVFIRDEVGTLPYADITVIGNLIIGGNWRGISLPDSTTGVVVRDNILAPIVRPPGSDLAHQTWLAVKVLPGRVIENNTMMAPQPDASDATVQRIVGTREVPAAWCKAFGIDPRGPEIARLKAELAEAKARLAQISALAAPLPGETA